MPTSAPKPCSRCGVLVRDGSSRCQQHKVVPWTKWRDDASPINGRWWRRLRDLVLLRDDGLCQPCLRAGRVTSATEVDHIVARADGGSHDPANLEAICRTCHRAKTAREAHAPRHAVADARAEQRYAPGGHRISTSPKAETDAAPIFLRARVLGVGGS